MDAIGDGIIGALEPVIEDAMTSPEGRARVRRCLPHLGAVIEDWCPAVMVWPPGCFQMVRAYGPAGAQPGDINIAVATVNRADIVSFSGWPRLKKGFPDFPFGEVVSALADEVDWPDSRDETDRGTAMMGLLSVLIDRKQRQIYRRSATAIRRDGRTPILAVMVGVSDGKVSLLMHTLALPAPLECQIARIEEANRQSRRQL